MPDTTRRTNGIDHHASLLEISDEAERTGRSINGHTPEYLRGAAAELRTLRGRCELLECQRASLLSALRDARNVVDGVVTYEIVMVDTALKTLLTRIDAVYEPVLYSTVRESAREESATDA